MARRARVLAHGRLAACQVQQGVGRNVQRQRGFSRQVLSARSVETGGIVVAQRNCHFVDRKIRIQKMIKTVCQMAKKVCQHSRVSFAFSQQAVPLTSAAKVFVEALNF